MYGAANIPKTKPAITNTDVGKNGVVVAMLYSLHLNLMG